MLLREKHTHPKTKVRERSEKSAELGIFGVGMAEIVEKPPGWGGDARMGRLAGEHP
jgi:hypothetical protein